MSDYYNTFSVVSFSVVSVLSPACFCAFLPVFRLVYLSVCVSVRLSVCLSVCVPYVCLSVCMPVGLFVSLSVFLSPCLPVCPTVCLSVSLHLVWFRKSVVCPLCILCIATSLPPLWFVSVPLSLLPYFLNSLSITQLVD